MWLVESERLHKMSGVRNISKISRLDVFELVRCKFPRSHQLCIGF